jgi:hypothetical protein
MSAQYSIRLRYIRISDLEQSEKKEPEIGARKQRLGMCLALNMQGNQGPTGCLATWSPLTQGTHLSEIGQTLLNSTKLDCIRVRPGGPQRANNRLELIGHR